MTRVPVFRGAGVTVVNAESASEMLSQSGLAGWDVRKQAIFTADRDGNPFEVTDKKATVRTDPATGDTDVLGIVSNHYQVFQNEELADVMDKVADVSGSHYDTAGSFRQGKRVFVSMQLPGTFTVAGLDTETHNTYLLGTTTHDGKGQIQYVTTPVRVICQNTLSTGLKSMVTQFAVRHKGEMSVKVQEVRDALELQHKAIDDFQAEAERMLNESMTDMEFAKLTSNLWAPSETNVAKIREDKLSWLWKEADTVEGIRGTNWGAYQVITEYTDHYDAPSGTPHHRASRAVDGAGLTRKEKAFSLLAV